MHHYLLTMIALVANYYGQCIATNLRKDADLLLCTERIATQHPELAQRLASSRIEATCKRRLSPSIDDEEKDQDAGNVKLNFTANQHRWLRRLVRCCAKEFPVAVDDSLEPVGRVLMEITTNQSNGSVIPPVSQRVEMEATVPNPKKSPTETATAKQNSIVIQNYELLIQQHPDQPGRGDGAAIPPEVQRIWDNFETKRLKRNSDDLQQRSANSACANLLREFNEQHFEQNLVTTIVDTTTILSLSEHQPYSDKKLIPLTKEIRQTDRSGRLMLQNAMKKLKDEEIDATRKLDIILRYAKYLRRQFGRTATGNFTEELSFVGLNAQILLLLQYGIAEGEPLASFPYWNTALDFGLPNPCDSILFTADFFPELSTILSQNQELSSFCALPRIGELIREIKALLEEVQRIATSFQETRTVNAALADQMLEILYDQLTEFTESLSANNYIDRTTEQIFNVMTHNYINLTWSRLSSAQLQQDYLDKDNKTQQGIRSKNALAFECSQSKPFCSSPWLFCDLTQESSKCLAKIRKDGSCTSLEALNACHKSYCNHHGVCSGDTASESPSYFAYDLAFQHIRDQIETNETERKISSQDESHILQQNLTEHSNSTSSASCCFALFENETNDGVVQTQRPEDLPRSHTLAATAFAVTSHSENLTSSVFVSETDDVDDELLSLLLTNLTELNIFVNTNVTIRVSENVSSTVSPSGSNCSETTDNNTTKNCASPNLQTHIQGISTGISTARTQILRVATAKPDFGAVVTREKETIQRLNDRWKMKNVTTAVTDETIQLLQINEKCGHGAANSSGSLDNFNLTLMTSLRADAHPKNATSLIVSPTTTTRTPTSTNRLKTGLRLITLSNSSTTANRERSTLRHTTVSPMLNNNIRITTPAATRPSVLARPTTPLLRTTPIPFPVVWFTISVQRGQGLTKHPVPGATIKIRGQNVPEGYNQLLLGKMANGNKYPYYIGAGLCQGRDPNGTRWGMAEMSIAVSDERNQTCSPQCYSSTTKQYVNCTGKIRLSVNAYYSDPIPFKPRQKDALEAMWTTSSYYRSRIPNYLQFLCPAPIRGADGLVIAQVRPQPAGSSSRRSEHAKPSGITNLAWPKSWSKTADCLYPVENNNYLICCQKVRTRSNPW